MSFNWKAVAKRWRAEAQRLKRAEEESGAKCCVHSREASAIREVLRRVEWEGDFCDGPSCPVCLRAPWKGHTKSCALKGALE